MAAAGGVNIWRLLYKIPLLLAIVGCYALAAGLAQLLWRKQRARRLQVIVAINSFLGKTALGLLNMEVQIEGHVPADRCFFIVSNHMSYNRPAGAVQCVQCRVCDFSGGARKQNSRPAVSFERVLFRRAP